MPKTVAIIQARWGSTRLPGKILIEIAGRPMLWHVVERVRRAKRVDEVVVATTDQSIDDQVETFCKDFLIPVYRGSENDVLDRFYRCAEPRKPDALVRITADCPLIDPDVIDAVIAHFYRTKVDYVANFLKVTYPDGLDTEVFSFDALEQAWKEAQRATEREHVTPYIRNSGKFRVSGYENPKPISAHEMRWTVDEARDLEFVKRVFQELSNKPDFGWEDVVGALARKKEIQEINRDITSNSGYYKSLFQEAKGGSAPKKKVSESEKWHNRSLKVIPGGLLTFSKGTAQYVQGVSPIFLKSGRGCRVTDVDGNSYIDFVQGLLPNILGYANQEVNRAVYDQIQEGHSYSLSHPIEVRLAEKLTQIIPCAEMVRFGKNGSDATAGAVRAARAFTSRERVAACGYHGWQDWFIGSTTRNAGVPVGVREIIDTFTYNDLGSLEAVLKKHPNEFAAVILEPANFTPPTAGFLEGVKKLAEQHGAVLIFDEICTGFHFGIGGAQKRFGVTPHLACFGKAMGNGFPISCVVGRKDIMKVFEEIFFSFTFAGDASAMAASLKVVEILENTDALAQMESNGRMLQDGFNSLAKEAGLYPRFECVGYPWWSLMKFRDATGKDSFLERSLFQQEAVKRGILHLVTHNFTASHDRAVVEETLQSYAAVFKTLRDWLSDKDPSRFLEGPMIQPVFKVR